MTSQDDYMWSDEVRQKAAESVYHSIADLEKVASGEPFDRFETAEENEKIRAERYKTSLQFLKNSLTHSYYEGFLDKKKVQDAIDAAEANPVTLSE